MKAKTTALLCALALGASSAHALSSMVTTTVVYAGTYGNGDIFVGLTAQINEPGCPNARIDVPASHPYAKQILATAQAAMLSGKRISVVTNGCYTNQPTLDTSRDSFFFIDDR